MAWHSRGWAVEGIHSLVPGRSPITCAAPVESIFIATQIIRSQSFRLPSPNLLIPVNSSALARTQDVGPAIVSQTWSCGKHVWLILTLLGTAPGSHWSCFTARFGLSTWMCHVKIWKCCWEALFSSRRSNWVKKMEQIVRQVDDSTGPGMGSLMPRRHTVGQLARPVTQRSGTVRKAKSALCLMLGCLLLSLARRSRNRICRSARSTSGQERHGASRWWTLWRHEL